MSFRKLICPELTRVVEFESRKASNMFLRVAFVPESGLLVLLLLHMLKLFWLLQLGTYGRIVVIKFFEIILFPFRLLFLGLLLMLRISPSSMLISLDFD